MSGIGPGWETVPCQRCGGAGQIWDVVRDVMVGPDRGRTKSTAAAHLYELIGEVGRLERELNQAELREAHLRNGVRELLDICSENLEIVKAEADGRPVSSDVIAAHCKRLTDASERLLGKDGYPRATGDFDPLEVNPICGPCWRKKGWKDLRPNAESEVSE